MKRESFADPFDPDISLDETHESPLNNDVTSGENNKEDLEINTPEKMIDRKIEIAVVRALFGGDEVSRRKFMETVGKTAAAAIIGSLFPLGTAKAIAKENVKNLEKKDLSIGFIPITCATPIIMAEPMGFYKKHGLNTKVRRASVGGVRSPFFRKICKMQTCRPDPRGYNRKIPIVSAISQNAPGGYQNLVNTIRQEITKTGMN